MARNTNPWCKIYFRDWLESERVMEMSCAAEGLYMRCLLMQTVRTNLPQSLHKLALLLRKPVAEVEKVWHEVAPHFDSEEVDGEVRLFNARHRELLEEDAGKSKNYSKAAKKREQAKRKQDSTTILLQSDQYCAVRASVSASVSASDSVSVSKSLENFDRFWLVYPRRQQKKAAVAAWKKAVTSDELAEKIISHVEIRAKTDSAWLKDGGQYVPQATTFLNQGRWEDEYQTGTHRSSAPVPHYQRHESQGFDYDIISDWPD